MRAILLDVLFWSFIACFSYLIILNLSTVLLILYASLENLVRGRESRTEDYDTLAVSRFTIPVSVVAAAYNEEAMILPGIRSLLAMDYPELEIILVNDGSKDDTLKVLIEAYDLKPVEMFYRRIFETETVRGIYRSADELRLIVVDKENGGKADALNSGINLSRYRYVCCVDGDCIYTRDALLKGMRLAVKDPANVVGVTSLITIRRHPESASQTELDRHLLSNFQHLDYLRSFLIARSAWSRLNFMLCAIGAFQIWRRDVLVEVGGFSRDFTCEDIELTFRIYEKFLRERRPCTVLSFPDTVGMTEGPDRFRSLVSQRARWQRVIFETFWHYRRMFLNPRYGNVGMLGMPYYFLSEILSPLFQVLSLSTLALAIFLGVLTWKAFFLIVAILGLLTGINSTLAVWLQDASFRDHPLRDLVRLAVIAPFDIILYRPALFFAQAKGMVDFFRGKKGWNKFERNVRKETAEPGVRG